MYSTADACATQKRRSARAPLAAPSRGRSGRSSTPASSCLYQPLFRGLFRAALSLALAAPLLSLASPALSSTTPERARIEETIRALSGFPSRVTGYGGAGEAAKWIERSLREASVPDIRERVFRLPIPVDEGSALMACSSGDSIRVHPLWPNLVRTSTVSPSGVEGVLVDGGDGQYRSLDGKDVRDQLVLLDYNSGMAWVNAFNLGARAVLFSEPSMTHRKESELKFLTVPADLPRFYVPAAEAGRLKKLVGERVRLTARQTWRNLEARTVIGFVQGKDPVLQKQLVVVEAYYDAISAVPSLAPGAEAASGLAGLLEVSRRIASQPPDRSVAIVAAPGHFEGLAGIRDLVGCLRKDDEDYKDDEEYEVAGRTDGPLKERLRGYRPVLFIGLDLSSQSDRIGVYQGGSPYRTRTRTPAIWEAIFRLAASYEREFFSGEHILANGLKPSEERAGVGGMPLRIPFDGGAVQLDGILALTFCTVNDDRRFVDTPLDVPERMDFDKLAAQVSFLSAVIPGVIDDPAVASVGEGKRSFGVLSGRVVRNGSRSAFPDSQVAGALVRARIRHKVQSGVRMDMLTMADAEGRFRIDGMESGVLYARPVRIEAYGVDQATGDITEALDLGVNGEGRSPAKVLMDPFLKREMTAIAFGCKAVTLFDLVDPRRLASLDQLRVIDGARDAEPVSYGVCLPLTPSEEEVFGYVSTLDSYVEPCAVVFAEPASRIKIAATYGRYGIGERLLLLNSEPLTSPKASGALPPHSATSMLRIVSDPHTRGVTSGRIGSGFAVDSLGSVQASPYQVARDMGALNGQQIGILARHGVKSGRLHDFQGRSTALCDSALLSLSGKAYASFIDQARQAWGFACRAKQDIAGTKRGLIVSAGIVLLLLIPFSFASERLLFAGTRPKRRLAAGAGVFVVFFIIVRFIHPAFALANLSAPALFVGFTLLVLSGVGAAASLVRLHRYLRALTSHRRHRADVQRVAMLFRAVDVGIAHMRRRPLRTVLTASTIVMVTFSALAFTSVQFSLAVNRIPVGQDATYEGILVRLPAWRAMEAGALVQLVDRFGEDHVTARIWKTAVREMVIESGHRKTALDHLLGVSPAEKGATGLDRSLAAGRWFHSPDEQACLLPKGVADDLGVRPGGLIRMFGQSFTVAGIFDEDRMWDIRDLNGEPLTPLDPEAQQPAEGEKVSLMARGGLISFAHAKPERVVILPAAIALRNDGACIRSIAVLTGADRGWDEIDRFASLVGLNVVVGHAGRRYLINTVDTASVASDRNLAVPVSIAALIILNTMMGSVFERKGEIATFNSVGLAPAHVAGMFVSEAAVYALLGGVAGYVLGQAAAILLVRWDLLEGLTLNFSSRATAATLVIAMGTVVASSVYPASLSRRLCVPGIERRWRIPAGSVGSVGGVITLELPFTFRDGDVPGAVEFLSEYLKTYEESSIGGGFVTSGLCAETRGADRLLTSTLTLAPFDRGVTETCTIVFSPEGGIRGLARTSVLIERKTGEIASWRRGNGFFLNELRKQFLVWKALPPQDRRHYVHRAGICAT